MIKERIDAMEADQALQMLRPNRLERRIQASKVKRVSKPTCACCAPKDEGPPNAPAR